MRLDDSILKTTLQDLDGQDWGEPNYPSYLVTEYHRLQRVPLEGLDVENLRLLIGQEMSLDNLVYLLPLAFAHLQREPWISGAHYDGDLLKSVLSVSHSFWHTHPELKQTFDQIVKRALAQAKAAAPEQTTGYDARVIQRLRKWQQVPEA